MSDGDGRFRAVAPSVPLQSIETHAVVPLPELATVLETTEDSSVQSGIEGLTHKLENLLVISRYSLENLYLPELPQPRLGH